MKRRDLTAILRVRELIERQRQLEAARNQQLLDAATDELGQAMQRQLDTQPPSGNITGDDLYQLRSANAGIADHVERAAGNAQTEQRDHQDAFARYSQAGVARRAAERLDERQRTALAFKAARRAEQYLDELALQQWRRQ